MASSATREPARRERPGKAAILRAAVRVMGEQGYEGASMRDMAAGAGVTVAALYYHFPSKHDLLREFLDESWSVVLARVDRRLAAVDPTPPARLDEVVATVIASFIHDEFALLASNVALREHTRLDAASRRGVEAKRERLLAVVHEIVATGVATGDFTTDQPRETARAVLLLCGAVVEPFPTMGLTMAEVIALHQRFARALASPPAAGH